MWFKSITLLQMQPPKDKGFEDFKKGLEKQPIGACPSTVAQVHGWSSPFGIGSDNIIVSANGFHMTNFVVAKRLLPQDVIKQTLAQRVAILESQQGAPVSKREQRRMQDEIHFELLPKAFVQQKSFSICWHESSGFIYVGTTQAAMIENLIACLAFCCPGWRVRVCQAKQSIENTLTGWLNDPKNLPEGFRLNDSCHLLDPANRLSSIKFNGNDIESSLVKSHLKDGFYVKQASLVWQEQICFVLNPNMALSQIKYIEIERDDSVDQSPEAILLGDLSLLAPLYFKLLESIVNALGGLEEAKSQDSTMLQSEELITEIE